MRPNILKMPRRSLQNFLPT